MRLSYLHLRFPKGTIIAFFIWGTFALVVGFFSALLDVNLHHVPNRPVSSYLICGLAPAFGLFLFWIVWYCGAKGWITKHVFPFRDRRNRPYVFTGLFLATVGSIAFLSFGDHLHYQEIVKNNLGGVFALVSGVATFAGVYLTLQSVLDMRATITTFSDLVKHVCDLIDDTKGSDYIKFLAWTPALGCLSLPRYQWLRLYKLLYNDPHQKKPLPRVQFTCLKTEDLVFWHDRFINRNTDRDLITEDLAKEASDVAESILGQFNQAEDLLKPVRKRLGRLPGYYLFANSDRAIVVAPFFIQLPPGLRTQAQNERKLPSVQLLGFETTDQGIVSMIHDVIEVYRNEEYVSDEAPFFDTNMGTDVGSFAQVLERIRGTLESKLSTTGMVEPIQYRLEAFEKIECDEIRN